MFKPKRAFSGFSVDNLAAAQEFYGGQLGLKIAAGGVGLRLDLPNNLSVFIYPKPDHQPASFTVLNFVVENIDTAVRELTAQGERYAQIPQDEQGIMRQYGPPIAWFKDPAGNILAVIEQ